MAVPWNEEDAYLVAERAHEWAMQGCYGEAEILLTGLVAAVPGYGYARRALGAILLQTGRAGEALGLLESSRDLAGRTVRLEALIALGRRGEAERELAALRGGMETGTVERLAWRINCLGS